MNILKALRLPDLFSLLNATLGFWAIIAACNGETKTSAALVVLAAIADGVDGIIARRIGPGPLGEDLDSLADLISFGAAPAILAVTNFSLGWVGGILGGFYLICGAMRLARFDISEKNFKTFEGLPIPAAGVVLVATILFGIAGITLITILFLSILMISSIRYPKIEDSRLSYALGLFFLIIAYIFMSENSNQESILYANIFLFTISTIYLFSPVVISLIRIER
ncbi:MAG: CDP-diacylglycerol--serine O-phosphatidyltransferase [Methanotrichaceae archaeon]|nr:CDP-diacylglycerol--serine O-phosphatidyltransferase [Methanotrichaceae archaeon]